MKSWLRLLVATWLLVSGVLSARVLQLFPYKTRQLPPPEPNNTGIATAPPVDFAVVPPDDYNAESGTPVYTPKVSITNDDARERVFVVQLREEEWVDGAPSQFIMSAFRFQTHVPRNKAPFGFETHLKLADLQQDTTVQVINTTTAILMFPVAPLFDAKESVETVDIVVDGAALKSGRPIGPASFSVAGEYDASQITAWAVFYFAVAYFAALVDPHAVVDFQAFVMMLYDPCSRAFSRRTASGCLRAFAPLSFYEDPPATTLFLSSFLIVLVQAGAFAAEFFYRKKELDNLHFGVHYSLFAFVFLAGAMGTWRQLYDPKSAEYVFLGIVGIGVYVVLPFLVLMVWRIKYASRARFYRYSWFRNMPRWKRFMLPSGFWGPEEIYTQHRLMIKNCARLSLSMVVFPFVIGEGFAIVRAAVPESPQDCSSKFIVISVWYFLAAAYVGVFRIYRTSAQNTFVIVTYATSFLGAMGGALQAARSEMPGTALYVTCGVLIITVTLVRLCHASYLLLKERTWILKTVRTGEPTTVKQPKPKPSAKKAGAAPKKKPTPKKAGSSAGGRRKSDDQSGSSPSPARKRGKSPKGGKSPSPRRKSSPTKS